MDRPTATKLNKIITQAVRKAIKDSGLKLTLKTSPGTFSKNDYAVKITLLEQDKRGMTIGGEVDTFLKKSELYDIPKEWLNQNFNDRRKTFTIEHSLS